MMILLENQTLHTHNLLIPSNNRYTSSTTSNHESNITLGLKTVFYFAVLQPPKPYSLTTEPYHTPTKPSLLYPTRPTWMILDIPIYTPVRDDLKRSQSTTPRHPHPSPILQLLSPNTPTNASPIPYQTHLDTPLHPSPRAEAGSVNSAPPPLPKTDSSTLRLSVGIPIDF